MDKIHFKLGEYVEDVYCIRHADVYINGLRLLNLVCKAENQHYKTKHCADACGYTGLHITGYSFRNDEFPGVLPDSKGRSEFWGAVLTCTCGFDMCSSIVARVEILGDFILWHEVLNPWLGPLPPELKDMDEYKDHVPCDYSAIGPYVFRRKQYIEAWYSFKNWVMDWKRWTKFSVYRR